MTMVSTSLRQSVDAADRLRFDAVSPFTATDVQAAIIQSIGFTKTVNPTPVNVAQSPYTPLSTDTILLVDTSAGPVSIQMPVSSARGGVPLAIIDATGSADVNPISVLTSGGETINGMNPYPIDASFSGAGLSPKTGGYFVNV